MTSILGPTYGDLQDGNGGGKIRVRSPPLLGHVRAHTERRNQSMEKSSEGSQHPRSRPVDPFQVSNR